MRIFQKGFNFSQDGPGNRLVYHLQGCNLRCPWCSNPEGLNTLGGTDYPVCELLEEAIRSRMMFFEGGGVTLTGGEVMMQFDEVRELLTGLQKNSIHTCVETNGIDYRLPRLFSVLDLLIMDIKHYDPYIHKTVTGAENIHTIENIQAAIAAKQPLALRIPLIGGFNASQEDACAFGDLFSTLGVQENATVELLAYHEYGKDKYRALGMEYTMDACAKVTAEQVRQYSKILTDYGITIIKT